MNVPTYVFCFRLHLLSPKLWQHINSQQFIIKWVDEIRNFEIKKHLVVSNYVTMTSLRLVCKTEIFVETG